MYFADCRRGIFFVFCGVIVEMIFDKAGMQSNSTLQHKPDFNHPSAKAELRPMGRLVLKNQLHHYLIILRLRQNCDECECREQKQFLYLLNHASAKAELRHWRRLSRPLIS